ncbi:MAG TPA: S46 family peptidase [Rubricoccaceae bacterium]|nr:S46 family peptidase [Rubricoccaceae bacterium]
MRRLALLALLLPVLAQAQPAFDPDTVQAGRLDGGKMWLFEDPPYDYLEETYGFRPDAGWFERARLASLRMPGCSASFVSPHGLVATNHHCAQGSVIEVSAEGEGLLDAGFFARSLEEERPVPGMYMDQLVAIEDVTDEVLAATAGAQTDAERAAALEAATDAVEARLLGERGGEGAGFVVQVVGLYHGGRYSAYTFRRYTDVRLVMAPERALGYFGGDFDNFTFPRYATDFSFFRIYDADGTPLQSPYYFPLAEEGVAPGELVFVIGNPGSTSRGLTVAQLELTRDLYVPTMLRFLDSRIAAIQDYLATDPENPDAVRGQLFGLLNSQKAYRGRRDALADPYIMARRAAAERDFRAASPEAGGLIDRMAALQAERRELAASYRAFATLFNPTYGAATLLRARAAYDALQSDTLGFDAVLGQADRPPSVERAYLTDAVALLRAYFAETGRPLPAVLQGPDDAAVADRLLRESALASAASAEVAVEGGALGMDDPAVQLYAAIRQDGADLQSAWAGLGAREADLAQQLGRARFAAYGNTVPPDATFSLRFTDGVVRGYPFNGTFAAPFTTLYGLYDHYYSYCVAAGGIVTTGTGCDWELPERWLEAEDDLDLSTPVNFVSTSDTIGGNSGSPAVNADLELVGLNFDRTVEGLARDYVYLADRGRNVMVDVRVVLEALGSVYGMDDLLAELREGVLRE